MAPEYHRSYTLTITGGDVPASARLVVDSYDTIVHDVSAKVGPDDWAAVYEAAFALQVPLEAPDEETCPGGTSTTLGVTQPEGLVFEVSTGGCGGGFVAAELDAVVAPVLDDFDLDTLLAPGEVVALDATTSTITGPATNDVTGFVYRFDDASTPPDSHRSFVLTVIGEPDDSAEARLVVGSYGTVVHDVTVGVDAATWAGVTTAAAETRTSYQSSLDTVVEISPPETTGEPCPPGSTSQALTVSGLDDSWNVPLDACSSGGSLVAAIVDPVLARFDLDTLLAPGPVPTS